MADDQPHGENRNSPQGEVHIDCSSLGKNLDGGKTVAHGLPRRLRSSKQGGVPNDLGLIAGEMSDNEIARSSQYPV